MRFSAVATAPRAGLRTAAGLRAVLGARGGPAVAKQTPLTRCLPVGVGGGAPAGAGAPPSVAAAATAGQGQLQWHAGVRWATTAPPPASADPGDVEQWAADLVDNNAVVIVAKASCGYCRRAEAMISSLTDDYSVIYIDQLGDWPTMDEIQNRMGALTGARSVPRVFIGHKYFGDSAAVKAANATGELAAALRDAGVAVVEG